MTPEPLRTCIVLLGILNIAEAVMIIILGMRTFE